MSHLDEGTLHALLDGELDLSEVSEIQMHLGTCVACGSRLQEVKQVLAEADRLVGAVEVPAGRAPRPRAEPPRAESPRAEPPRMAPPPPRPPLREPEAWDETPVLLVPDPLAAQARRQRWMRGFKWAAAIVVVLGAGRILGSAFRPGYPTPTDRDLTSASPAVPPAVVSPEESRKPEPPVATLRPKSSRPAAQNRPPVPAPVAKTRAPVEERSPDTASQLADAVTPGAEETVAADSQLAAADEATDTGTTLAAVADSAGDRKARKDSTSEAVTQNDDVAVRGAAAAALAELDRERRRERANAATAALPPARPAQPESDAVAAPRTLEQRAQVYLRVGLDEAAKQLGGPVHVIEGMTPQFIGLVRGQLVPGADAGRPVVRVVYLDSRGRMILLDQQRTRAEPTPNAAGSLRWVTGDVMLYLRGEPSPEVLRSLQTRVR
ncbi:MAG TPA: zf-HC2 domain-containing protein [Gemmatimonadales bacterium]